MVLPERKKPTAEALEELREKIQSLPEVKSYEIEENTGTFELDDLTLTRFLVARNGNLNKATGMLKKHIIWRNKLRPSEITAKDLEYELGAGMWKISRQNTKDGYTFLHNSSEFFSPADHELKQVEPLTAFILEFALRKASHPEKKAVVLFDLGKYSLWKGHGGLKATRMTIGMVQTALNHYPETLKKIIVLNAPFVFQGLWKVLSPIIDPYTAEKITFTSDTTILLDYLDAEHIPESYGGTMKGDFLNPGEVDV